MLLEDTIDFLKKVPPFQFLDDSVLTTTFSHLAMEFFPKNTAILVQGGPPSDGLRIIKKGGVKVSRKSEEGEEVIIDYRGEGDTFGFLSLVGKDQQRTTVTAIEDTICYCLPKEWVSKLLESNTAFTEYFLKSHFSKYIHRTFNEMQGKAHYHGASDRLLFTTQVGEIATRTVITAAEDTSIQKAAQIMVDHRVSSLLIVDANRQPIGIITDRDLRQRVVAQASDVADPVKAIMSPPRVRVEARDYCFEAVVQMIRHNVHHILVLRDGHLQGMLTTHDLMMLQGSSPLAFAKNIENQQSIEGLVAVSRKSDKVINLLLKEGAKASNIARIITELNDRLVCRVLEIIEAQCGPPPLTYCWIVFGSEGRKEQTIRTDQDNAIVHADPESEEQARAARAYFARFTPLVREALIKCGFPECPANYMASNPEWCQPLKAWKKYFQTWIATPTAEAVLRSLIFFDFRAIHGELALAEALRVALTAMLAGQRLFLGHMANMIIKNTPPIGFLKAFVVEKDGLHKDQLNLKVKGLAPIVDIVRLFALEKGINETSTLERIKALADKHSIVKEDEAELEHAFEFLMLLRLHNQFEQIGAGREPNSFINPNALSNLEKKTLKEAFQLIRKIQNLIIERYKALIW